MKIFKIKATKMRDTKIFCFDENKFECCEIQENKIGIVFKSQLVNIDRFFC